MEVLGCQVTFQKDQEVHPDLLGTFYLVITGSSEETVDLSRTIYARVRSDLLVGFTQVKILGRLQRFSFIQFCLRNCYMFTKEINLYFTFKVTVCRLPFPSSHRSRVRTLSFPIEHNTVSCLRLKIRFYPLIKDLQNFEDLNCEKIN